MTALVLLLIVRRICIGAPYGKYRIAGCSDSETSGFASVIFCERA